MLNKRLRRACVAALLLMLAPVAGAAPEYFSTSPAGSKYARALALNNLGHFAVNSFGPETPYQGASIDRQPMGESVGGLGGYVTQIRAINDLDEAVGVSTTDLGEPHAFLYSNGRMQDLTARHGLKDAADINNRGEIAARTVDSRAAVLRDGAVHVIGPENSAAGDMNERGDVLVGYFDYTGGFGVRTAIYSDGTLTDLPLVGGRRASGQAINDAGWVTGYFTSTTGRVHAFLWDGGTFFNLTPWAQNSFGYDINELGQVVGVADGRAFLYADGELIDLNTRIDRDADLSLISADQINDRGQILAHSCDRAGVFCYGSRLLTPVPAIPEPPAIAMALAGLALLAGRRLRHYNPDQSTMIRKRRGFTCYLRKRDRSHRPSEIRLKS